MRYVQRSRAAFRVWTAVVLALAVAGCGGSSSNAHLNLPPPVESTAVGPGDVFHLEIVSEKDLPDEYQVASDGTVDLPYVHRLKVAGLEPQQIAALVRKNLMDQKILTDPSVVVSVKEYNSKRITVLGQVQKPGSFPFSSGLTLIQAISQAGGFNSIANKDKVYLTRKTDKGAKTVKVSVDAITEGKSPDILLQSGDQVYVNERIF